MTDPQLAWSDGTEPQRRVGHDDGLGEGEVAGAVEHGPHGSRHVVAEFVRVEVGPVHPDPTSPLDTTTARHADVEGLGVVQHGPAVMGRRAQVGERGVGPLGTCQPSGENPLFVLVRPLVPPRPRAAAGLGRRVFGEAGQGVDAPPDPGDETVTECASESATGGSGDEDGVVRHPTCGFQGVEQRGNTAGTRHPFIVREPWVSGRARIHRGSSGP